MTVRIDPAEVLNYLNSLGFCNITTDQLKEFISDLKKLIKYDLRQRALDVLPSRNTSERCSVTDEAGPSWNDSSVARRKPQNNESDRSSNVSRCATICTSSCAETGVECSSLEKYPIADPLIVKHAGPKKCRKDEMGNSRRRSAFIKPWNLQEPVKHCRSDPVALYHKYQSLWQQQKIPGDDCHVRLRWNVREKMLGKHPHPTPREN